MASWLERVASIRVEQGGLAVDESIRQRISERAGEVSESLGPKVRRILTADVDLAIGSPLALLRDGMQPLNLLLAELGVEAPYRDHVTAEMFPDDTYDLGPGSFADIHPDLQEAAITWGAARAHVHLHRHSGAEAVSDRPPFDSVLASVADVDGWMTDDQARLLHDRASALEPGERVVEIGSFRGRSIIVVALAAVPEVEIVAIDPHGGGDRGPQEIAPDQARGDDDHRVFTSNLARAGVTDRVNHIRKMSDQALGDVAGDIDLLYIDGAHRLGPARADIETWGDRVRPGGTMLIHDSFSSIGVTLALITTTFFGRRWRYVGRAQSMAEYQRIDSGPAARALNLLRQMAQLPWFVRNVVIKVLLTVKLAPLTRLLGHRGSDWPY